MKLTDTHKAALRAIRNGDRNFSCMGQTWTDLRHARLLTYEDRRAPGAMFPDEHMVITDAGRQVLVEADLKTAKKAAGLRKKSGVRS